MIFKPPDSKYLDVLIADQRACGELLQSDLGNQCLRRIYCRTNLALVEGGLSYFKSTTYQFNEGTLRPFANTLGVMGIELAGPIFCDIVPPEESRLLLDRQPCVGNKGKIRDAPRFLDFQTNFRFTFSMVDRVYKIDCSPDYGATPEWKELLLGVQTRNRITHPKVGENLDVSDEEIAAIATGCQWYMDYGGSVFTKIAESLSKHDEEAGRLGTHVLDAALRQIKDLVDEIRSVGTEPTE